MNIYGFTLVVGLGSVLAGFVGSLTGLGGGLVITPLLSLALGIDIHYAMGASLISAIATSSGAGAAFVKEGFTNVRIGMLLEIATTVGAVIGASAVTRLPGSVIATMFGILLLCSAYVIGQTRQTGFATDKADPLATRLNLDSSYPSDNGQQKYCVSRVPQGFGLMFVAGNLSGLLGIGSGTFKVIAMDQVMRIPFKVSTTTSNFMIGVTAAASAGIYLERGYIDPVIAMPVTLGVLAGSLLGGGLLPHARTPVLRRVFAVVVTVLAIEMIYHGVTGKL